MQWLPFESILQNRKKKEPLTHKSREWITAKERSEEKDDIPRLFSLLSKFWLPTFNPAEKD